MHRETTWEEVYKSAGYPEGTAPEMTSVTKRIRRVGFWDTWLAAESCEANGAYAVALHGLDYIRFQDFEIQSRYDLSEASRGFIEQVQTQTGRKVLWAYTGHNLEDMVTL
jgi:adenylosuccinate synthase